MNVFQDFEQNNNKGLYRKHNAGKLISEISIIIMKKNTLIRVLFRRNNRIGLIKRKITLCQQIYINNITKL